MTVSFEFEDKIIANAELSMCPFLGEVVKIYGEEYAVDNVRHEVEIKIKPSGKKAVIEKMICKVVSGMM